MMYIEHAPLEDNLHYILKKHAPAQVVASTATVLLAQVQEEANRRNLSNHQITQTDTLPAAVLKLQNNGEYKSNCNSKEAKILPKLISNCGNHCAENYKFENHIKADSYIIEQPTPIKPAAAPSPKPKQAQLEVELDESDTEQQYELFDVINSEEQQQTEVNQLEDFNTSRFEINLLDANRSREDSESEEFEYVLTCVPKRQTSAKPAPPPPPALIPASAELLRQKRCASENSLGQKRRRTLPALRPIPQAIPIAALHNSGAAAVRVLNGQLDELKRFGSQRSLCSSPQNTPLGNYSGHNGYITREPCEHFSDNDEADDLNEYYDHVFEPADSEAYRQQFCEEASQMGIDLFGKLKRLITFNSGTEYNTNEGKRKRRSEYKAADAALPKHFKYRKVESKFPKFISAPLDDDYQFVNPAQTRSTLFLERSLQKKPTTQIDLTSSSGTATSPMEKSRLRKTIFLDRPASHTFVKNANYADIEFSDDDEPQLVTAYGLGNLTAGSSSSATSNKLSAAHIPKYPSPAMSMSKCQPPPLIEARTGSILSSSITHDVNAMRKFSYADALRQGHRSPLTTTGSNILSGMMGSDSGGRASSICSSAASTSTSARLLNGCNTNPFFQERSILAQEKELGEREKYLQLLGQLVPKLYCSNLADSQQASQKQAELDRKRSALLVAAAGTASSAVNSPLCGRRPISTHAQPTSSQARRSTNISAMNALKQIPLSSTINLDDDDDVENENDEDCIELTKATAKHNRNRTASADMSSVIIDDDDDDISEIIDLGEDERKMVSACQKLKPKRFDDDGDVVLVEPGTAAKNNNKKQQSRELPHVQPINTLREKLSTNPVTKTDWLPNFQLKWSQNQKRLEEKIQEQAKVVEKLTAERQVVVTDINERFKQFQIIDPELVIIDDFPEPAEEEAEFIDLTPEHHAKIKAAVCGPADQVLVSKFNLNITRRDIHTLLGLNWLNDEVINFYMNLLTERGEKKHESHGLPSVYAMNTFFVPRLLQAGHGGVKRWTRKVDIFAKDVIPVPVHVGGVHWCMAIIHMKNKTIRYYDSMGSPNPNVLKALEQYLKDESLDKRKQPFDTSDFVIESVQDVPRQMNGSDCGVFSCMFAEYITRNRKITFSQQNMEYFRHKMLLEIVQGELFH